MRGKREDAAIEVLLVSDTCDKAGCGTILVATERPTVKLHHDETRRRYFFDLPEGEAYVTYVDQDGLRVLNHSYVSPSLRGTGVAAQVVGATFEAVMEDGVPSYPTCSYVQAIASRNLRWREYFLQR